jgi:hypothetical protein
MPTNEVWKVALDGRVFTPGDALAHLRVKALKSNDIDEKKTLEAASRVLMRGIFYNRDKMLSELDAIWSEAKRLQADRKTGQGSLFNAN